MKRRKNSQIVILVFFGIHFLSSGISNGQPVRDSIAVPQMLNELDVRSEESSGYDRGKFKLWSDTNSDSCDTREEVLITESKKQPSLGTSCKIMSGSWTSPYDGITATTPSSIDIDHAVPLKEAWESGANTWDKASRTAYANDLGYSGSLLAVSALSNRSKGANDPNNWMPSKAGYRCTYIGTWIAVKYRWQLSVDKGEKTYLSAELKKCGNKAAVIVPERVKVVLATASSGSNLQSTPVAPLNQDSSSDPRFKTCVLAKASGYGPYSTAADKEYHWYIDRDKDGNVCE